MKIDLNAPAFGQGAQKVAPADAEEAKVEAPVGEVIVPAVKPTVEGAPVIEEESKVPYSRFKKFHDRALEAEREAAEWRQKAESHTQVESADTGAGEMPNSWVKLYGDSEASKEAWQIQQNLNATMLADARREALEAVRNERYEETAKVEANVERLDESFEDLSAFIGRSITEAEQSALLDIVDEFTPKDRYGDYAGEILPFNKAWEIYELKTKATKAPTIQARNEVANLTGNKTQGENLNKEEQNKNWNPLDWNAYKSRI